MDTDSMDPLIITVAADSTVSWPMNDYCPRQEEVGKEAYIDELSEEYVDAAEAGASIAHIHGVRELDPEEAEDGKKMSTLDLDGWERMHHQITDQTDAIMQYGVASGRIEQKLEQMELGPDMMAYAFNAHDEYFNPVWEEEYDPQPVYGVHPRHELRTFLEGCNEHGIKPEVESFTTGAFFNLRELRKEGLFDDPVWTTLFLGWPGGTWTPPTPESLINFVHHLPDNVNWNVSCMDPYHAWDILTLAIMLGGHVRVGWEDNPFLEPSLDEDHLAETNVELVEKIADISRHLGREVATPGQAREIIGIE